jgi:hypothetical protein
MNKPRVLIRNATARCFRSELTLTAPFQPVPRAVLRSAFSLAHEQTCRARLRDYGGFLVKNVRTPLCNLVCTQVFTFSMPKLLGERNIRSWNFKSSGRKTTKTGGSDPTFSAFSRPKSFVGSLPPVLGVRQQARFAREGSNRTPVERAEFSTHDELSEFRITACMAGPQGGEIPQCQS